MTVQGAQIAGSAADAARHWKALREADDIQFEPLPPLSPPETPEWLEKLGEWLRDIFEPLGRMLGMSWPTIQNLLIALAIILALAVLWVLLRPLIDRLRSSIATRPEDEWVPNRDAATALLSDADRLAREGRYDEAVHLLLQRSVNQISEARPDWLVPASTAREIATMASLPERARHAFAIIAGRVEQSLFALHGLNEADWTAARTAYADFALAELPS